jgi:hypothetical protein
MLRPSIHCRDAAQYTPLHVAALNGQVDACKALIEMDANANMRDEKGLALVSYALTMVQAAPPCIWPPSVATWLSLDSCLPALQRPLAQMSTPKSQNDRTRAHSPQARNGETALHCSAQHGHTDMVILLLKVDKRVIHPRADAWRCANRHSLASTPRCETSLTRPRWTLRRSTGGPAASRRCWWARLHRPCWAMYSLFCILFMVLAPNSASNACIVFRFPSGIIYVHLYEAMGTKVYISIC